MKKVFLYAYDRQNLGDDLFIHTIVKRYPDVRFYLASDKKNKITFRCLPNLKVVDQKSFLMKMLQRIRGSLPARYLGILERRCEALVYIGGSIFMEYPQWAQYCVWWEYMAETYPFYALGANFGPWHAEGYREKMNEVFGKMQDVCFRDRYSYGLFPGNEKVRCAPDILFSYPMPQLPVKEKQLFVSVINCASRDESHKLDGADATYVQKMGRLLRSYREKGWNVVLSSFCQAEGDEEGVQRIREAMQLPEDSDVTTLYYDGTNVDRITAEIAQSDYVIGTRFHSVILAMVAGRPVLPVAYSDKTLRVLEDLGFTGEVFDLRKDTDWSFDRSLRNWSNQSFSLPQDTVAASQAHFEKLDSVLKRSSP